MTWTYETTKKPYQLKTGPLAGWWRTQSNVWCTEHDADVPGSFHLVFRFDTGTMKLRDSRNFPVCGEMAVHPDDGDHIDDKYAAHALGLFKAYIQKECDRLLAKLQVGV